MKLLLASQSPRRKELLSQLGYSFEVVAIDCDEVYPSNLPVHEVAGYLAELKANTYPVKEDEILLTADTIVAFDNEALGKPSDPENARAMLKKLSGKTHQVYTGICIKTSTQKVVKTDIAEVTVEDISDEEIRFYIDNFNPFDKAGAYGIQEWFGLAKITKINGNYFTIMGLPTHLVYNVLQNLNHKID